MINNTATPGLVSTNPFLNQKAITPTTGGTTTPLVGGTTGAQNIEGIIPYRNANPGVSTTSAVNFGSIPTGINGTLNNGVLPSSNKTSNQGLLNSATPAGASSGLGAVGTVGVGAGQAAPPPGYSYNADGTLTNASGQAYVPPAQNNVGANTYSGGVNSNGQTLPGYSASNPPTFPGLVSTLANTSSQPTPAFSASQGTAQTAATDLLNSTPGNNAAVLAQQQSIQKLQDEYAKESADISGTPGDLSLANGEQGTLYNRYSGQLGAQETGLSNILQGNAQQQAAYTGAAGAANTTAGAATAQQGTQQSGQATAAELAAPQPANALGTYNPVTGQYSQYGGASGGGAAQAGAVGTQIQQGATVQTMVGNQAQAQSLVQNLSSLLSQGGINPSMPGGLGALQATASGIQQWIDTQTGDPKYQNYANLINEISQKYATILNSSGGTPTDQSQISHQIINALASGQDLSTALQSLDKNATDSINALKGASQTNSLNGTQSNSTAGGGTTFGSFF